MAVESITVMGRQISYEIMDVDISQLEYYTENPRINYIISKSPPEKITQEFIEHELLKIQTTKDRIKDLEENKGLIDEVYVLGKKVVEGNTRLCAFRRLGKKYPDDPTWKKIKARVLHDSVNEEELFYILGTFHIKGKTEWDAYEKAAYIYKMIKVLKKNPDDVAKQIGKQRKTVEAMLRAYEVMSQKFLINAKDDDNNSRDDLKKYSYFEAFFLQKDLTTRAKETPVFIDDFVDMVKTDRLKKAQNVRELPKILGNKKACNAFYDNESDVAFDEAIHVLHEHRPDKVDRFYKKIREFRETIQASEVMKIKTEIEENKNKKAEILKCFKEMKKFVKELGLEV
jgi:hypothetical protein